MKKTGKRYELNKKFCESVPFVSEGQRLYFDSHKDAPRGFALRVTKHERSWILNYTVHGAQRRYTFPVGYPQWSASLAREKANELRTKILAGFDPLAAKKHDRAEAARKAREKAEQEEAETARRERTLGALLDAYADQLETQGKVSHSDVRGIIHNHVRDAHRKLWDTPAAEVEPEDGVEILRTLIRSGNLRTAGKLRSYMRAAYSAAVRSRLDPSSSKALAAFGLRSNPMADLPTIKGGAGKTRERALSESELRAYWKRIAAMKGADGALLRLHLLSGGQRINQLVRATAPDYDEDAKVLLLRDKKGKRAEARVHAVPLIDAAVEAIDQMRGEEGPYLVTLDEGETPADYHNINARIANVVDTMLATEVPGSRGKFELSERFTPGDLRRTVETRLAASGLSMEVRAQLQSHGLAGVQARHYDRHSYLDEKRAALETLYRIIAGKPASVATLRKRRSA